MANLDPSEEIPQAAKRADPSHLRSREGYAAIYTENGIASHVHVDRVCSDRSGVEIDFTIIPTPGLVTGRRRDLWDRASTLAVVGRYSTRDVRGWHSSGQGCAWSLFFDRQLIEEVIQIGATLHGKVDRSERLRILRNRLDRAFVEDVRC